MAKHTHHNDPDRFSAPWVDLGLHKTRTAGVRRLWLCSGDGGYLIAIAGEGSTHGKTRLAAIAAAKNW